MKRSGLGRGLDALFAVEDQGTAHETPPAEIPISEIDPNPNQPRRHFDPEKLQELARSIALHGVLQPLLVTPRDGRYLLVAGERRWRAARQAGLSTVPALVREMDDEQVAALTLVENLQRDDLNPMEEARGFQQLMERFRMTQAQAAERVGKSRSAVANALRLLTLPEPVQEMVARGHLSAGHARCLAGMEGAARQTALAKKAVDQGLSVRQLEALSRAAKPRAKADRSAPPAPELEEFIAMLRGAFGTRVSIQGDLERGHIVLSYYSRDDLERIYQIVQGLGA